MTPIDALTPFWHDDPDLTRFPPALRALVDAELAVGNRIVEIGHGFPAPPVGAYVRLAAKVSSRPRASSEGINFYERNGSQHSGEYADNRRFFFVLEPPDPEPPEPDMDAIRAAYAPKPDTLAALAMRVASRATDSVRDGTTHGASDGQTVDPPQDPPATSFTNTEASSGWTRVLHFADRRSPHEVQAALECTLMTLFARTVENGRLCLRATATVIGARYSFELRFVAALSSLSGAVNHYVLRVVAEWGELSSAHRDYYRKTSDSWYHLWTRDLMGASPPPDGAGSSERYGELVSHAMAFESDLDSVAALQRAVVSGLKRGGSYSNSHKEGGTTIWWRVDRFVRSDYGDDPGVETYTNEATFLERLRQFLAWEVGRNHPPGTLSDVDTWRLILRCMRPPA